MAATIQDVIAAAKDVQDKGNALSAAVDADNTAKAAAAQATSAAQAADITKNSANEDFKTSEAQFVQVFTDFEGGQGSAAPAK